MKSVRFWLLVLGLFAAVLAIGPVGDWLIRTEFQRRTGTQLSMKKCQFNLLTGNLFIEGAIVEPMSGSEETSIGPSSSMKIAKLWSKGSLEQLLYRKLAAPITAMNGVALEVTDSEERQVPAIYPVTQAAFAQPLVIHLNDKTSNSEIEQAFQNAQNSLKDDRLAYDSIARQVMALEQQPFQFENPLRDHASILAAQQRVTSLRRELDQLQTAIERRMENLQQSDANTQRVTSDESPVTDTVATTPEIEMKMIEAQARCLTEQFICSSVEMLKPYLGLSASLARRWLITNHSKSIASNPFSIGTRSFESRGQNYRFGTMHDNEVLFGSIHLDGDFAADDQMIPFTGKMKNIGSQSLREESSPAFDLVFNKSKSPSELEIPAVAINATIIPDRRGFRIQSQMIPASSLITSTASGDWQLAAFGQESSVILVWLIHQSEWSLDVDIRGKQCEIVVKRNAVDEPASKNPIAPKFEPCFSSHESVSIAKARIRGDLVNGLPEQRSFLFASPILGELEKSMAVQEKKAIELSNVLNRQKAEAFQKQAADRQQSSLVSLHRQFSETYGNLQSRLMQFELKLAQSLQSRENLRLSSESPESLLR
ncbi:MAG: hypothetical protein SGI77_07590 [Pirellulaceae bacterium]|nr:hypothetical protein [Pirellulaceae bacterium]